MGDSQSRRVRGSSVKDLCARQRGIRIDLEGDGDQRQYKNADKGSHGPACRARMRLNQSNNSAKNGSFISEMPFPGTCSNFNKITHSGRALRPTGSVNVKIAKYQCALRIDDYRR
jgi:hypothetical protein